MMRVLFFTIIFITSQIALGQKHLSKIDSLRSERAVEKLIHSLDKEYEYFHIKPITQFVNRWRNQRTCKGIADSLGITNSFYKADFDNNGYTDLLAIGEYYDFMIFIVMNYGGDSLNINPLTRRSFRHCTFPKIINDTMIRYFYIEEPDWRQRDTSSNLSYIDLVSKFGDFVEYNPQPASYSIEKIEYKTTMCFGTCPIFEIGISNDKSAFFRAIGYNRPTKNAKEIRGEFNTILKDHSFLEIIDLLNYIDFPNLNNNYSVNWTDDQSCTLKITYDNGKVKTIEDYGLIGTYGLDRVYQLLFALRFNQEWK